MIGNLTNLWPNSLQVLSIGNTNLTGEILSSDYFDFSKITQFIISNNAFSGTIDESVCDIDISNDWEIYFKIDYNDFTGTIPSCFFDTFFENHRYLNNKTVCDDYIICILSK